MNELNINLKSASSITNLETLGLYAFIQIIMQHESSVLPLIIDRIKEQFKVDQKFILEKMKELEECGLLYIAKTTQD